MSGHSPAPWTWDDSKPDDILIGGDGAAVVVQVKGVMVDDADKRLIAAAPELLAALKLVLEPGALIAMEDVRALIARIEAP